MQSKLGLDFKKVEHAKSLAKDIANEVQAFVESKTTVAVERTLCRLMGIDGVDENQVPLPNVVVDDLKSKGVLGEGVLFYIANAMVNTGLTPQEVAEKVGYRDYKYFSVEFKAFTGISPSKYFYHFPN